MRLFRCHSPQCQVLVEHFSPRFIMPSKPRKSTPHSSKPAKKPRDAKAPKKGPSGAKSAPKEVDIFSPAAMENLYYISHNAVDCLTFRGFGWSQAKSKKKKKGSKPKKKK